MTLVSHWIIYTTANMRIGNDLSGVTRTGGPTGGPGNNAIGRNAVSILAGSGSLFFYAEPTATTPIKIGQVVRSGESALLSGTYRTVLRINDRVAAGAGFAGILCMQSQSNLTTGGGNGYGFAWEGGTVSSLMLFQFSGGLAASQMSSLSTGGLLVAVSSPVALQLHWAVSGTTVTLQADAGLGLSYDALSALYSAVILASAFTTTQGQCLWAMQRNNSISALDVSMDVSERTV